MQSRRLKAILAVLLASGVLLAALVFANRPVPNEKASERSAFQGLNPVPTSQPSAPKEPATAISANNVASGPQQPPRPLGTELLQAADWRVFAEWAKRHPELGGMYYASIALNSCGDVRKLLETTVAPAQEVAKDSGHTAHARDAARLTLSARCGSFLESEVGLSEPRDLREQGRQRGDKLAIAMNDLETLLKAKSTAAQREEMFGRVLATQDPQLILSAGLQLQSGGRQPVVGGVAVDREIAELAWNMAACSFGVDCTVKGMDVLLACAFYGTCADSSAALLQATAVQEVGEDGWKRAQLLAARISADVKAGKAASFVVLN